MAAFPDLATASRATTFTLTLALILPLGGSTCSTSSRNAGRSEDGRAPAFDDAPTSSGVSRRTRGPGATTVNHVTIAVVSDIAEMGRTQHARSVARLIHGHVPTVGALILGGDNARYGGSGSLFGYYTTYYGSPREANFGQFDAIVFPQLGNHEYIENKAQGYFDYFAARMQVVAALPSYHGSINTVGRGWYSVDLNGWHFVSLNGNCGEIPGGCDAGGAQDQWLVGDLAQHAGMPTIAVWHSPRWTCSVGGHDGDSTMQNFWARLYDAHADFVFNGHNHLYQRYKPLGKAATATEDSAAGITEIVVGSGGVSTYDVCSASEDTHVAKALGGDAGIGVLFLALGSDGSYAWEYRLKSNGSVFDAGTGLSHNAP